MIFHNEKKELHENGVTHIKNFFDTNERNILLNIADDLEKNPSLFMQKAQEKQNGSEFNVDFNNWRRNKNIENICKYTKLINLLTMLVGSKKCWLYHDVFFLKSGKAEETPWHTDRPYYIFKGKLNMTIWVPFQDVPEKYGMKFLKKSHIEQKMLIPEKSSGFLPYDGVKSDDYKLIDENFIDQHDQISFDVKFGDLLVFWNGTVHGVNAHNENFKRRSMAVRYLMDGASLTKKFMSANPPFDKLGVNLDEDGDIPENWFPRLA